ncbi:hypothetical protein QL285_050167 [Trifolium repens]|nr:hypothetical protein QL285_050167 [Trifolium repens]
MKCRRKLTSVDSCFLCTDASLSILHALRDCKYVLPIWHTLGVGDIVVPSSWSPPPMDWEKVNCDCDGAVTNYSGMTACGGIIRSSCKESGAGRQS